MCKYYKENIQFNKIEYKDLDSIKNLQPPGWPDIIQDFKKYLINEFCDPIKVIFNDNTIGIGNSIFFKKSAWIAHVIVDKEYRNRGIGYKIVDFLLSGIKKKNIKAASLIATELGEPVYKKAGFRVISNYIYLKRKKRWIEKELSKYIQTYKSIYYDQIADLDILISGEYRESLLKKYLDDCLIYIENQTVKGFYLPSLGEGPIYAANPEVGIELMKMKYLKTDRAVIPSENKHGIEFLINNGFVRTNSTGKRMIWGKDINWKPGCFFSRIGGNYG